MSVYFEINSYNIFFFPSSSTLCEGYNLECGRQGMLYNKAALLCWTVIALGGLSYWSIGGGSISVQRPVFMI